MCTGTKKEQDKIHKKYVNTKINTKRVNTKTKEREQLQHETDKINRKITTKYKGGQTLGGRTIK